MDGFEVEVGAELAVDEAHGAFEEPLYGVGGDLGAEADAVAVAEEAEGIEAEHELLHVADVAADVGVGVAAGEGGADAFVEFVP